MENLPRNVDRRSVDDGQPSGMERRLVLRLLEHWRGLSDGERVPSFADLNPADIPDIWRWGFVLDVGGHENDPVFRMIGDDLADISGASLVGRKVSDVPALTLIGTAVQYAGEVLARKVPISRGGEFVESDGTRVLYRSIILPMSDDGETVSGLFGAANCREIRQEDDASNS